MDKVWVDKSRYDNAERLYYELLSKTTQPKERSPLASEIAKAREHIQLSLEKLEEYKFEPPSNVDVLGRLAALEAENKEIRNLLSNFLSIIENRVGANI